MTLQRAIFSVAWATLFAVVFVSMPETACNWLWDHVGEWAAYILWAAMIFVYMPLMIWVGLEIFERIP